MVDNSQLDEIRAQAESVIALERPAYLIKKVLGYEFYACHRRWFELQTLYQRTELLAPRGHGKSTICTVAYCIHKLLNHPNRRILLISNTDTQATILLGEIKEQFESDPMVRLFGSLKGKVWGKHRLTLATRTKILKEASITAMGVGGPVISGHYDDIILDDMVDEENAASETQRASLRVWFKKTLLPTLEFKNITPDRSLHIMGTRYHPLDYYQDIIDLASDEERAIEESKELGVAPYKILVDGAIQPDGRALCPQMADLPELLSKKREMGSIIFALQYQNDAELAKGSLFKPEWFRYYHGEIPEELYCIIDGVDPQVGEDAVHDYYANIGVGVSKSGNFYVLRDITRSRPTFRAKKRITAELAYKRKSTRSHLESVGGFGDFAAAVLEIAPGLAIVKEKPTRNKVMRAGPVSALLEGGRLYLPANSLAAELLVEEMMQFPDGEHDDQVDALAMAIKGCREMTQGLTFTKQPPSPAVGLDDVFIQKLLAGPGGDGGVFDDMMKGW